MIGQLLGGRYEISSILATGGMSQTYLARDNQRPGQPTCVVKRLQPPSTDPDQLQLARRLFNTEAEVLHQLGTHDQIPQLLAYFEEAGEFYLIQEFIEGTLLFDQLKTGQPWSESQVIQFLKDVLQLLDFVHDRGAIHRDIKPGNLIQRPDGTWVLLDFGAVKQVHLTQLQAGQDMSITVAIGTPGYLAPESICGKPRFSSDIFSLGIIGICALTGFSPDVIQDNSNSSISWPDRCPHTSDRLKAILERMTQLNFALRYTTATQVLADLDQIDHQANTLPETILAPPHDSRYRIPNANTEASLAPSPTHPQNPPTSWSWIVCRAEHWWPSSTGPCLTSPSPYPTGHPCRRRTVRRLHHLYRNRPIHSPHFIGL